MRGSLLKELLWQDRIVISPEALALQRIRRRRLLMFGLFLGFVPAEFLVWSVTGSDGAAFALFGVWAVTYVLSGFLVIYCRCPRCGEFFHQGPFRWPHERRFLGVVKPSVVRRLSVVTPFTRHCLNCGLSLKPRQD
jgi:hypothetical protein